MNMKEKSHKFSFRDLQYNYKVKKLVQEVKKKKKFIVKILIIYSFQTKKDYM